MDRVSITIFGEQRGQSSTSSGSMPGSLVRAAGRDPVSAGVLEDLRPRQGRVSQAGELGHLRRRIRQRRRLLQRRMQLLTRAAHPAGHGGRPRPRQLHR